MSTSSFTTVAQISLLHLSSQQSVPGKYGLDHHSIKALQLCHSAYAPEKYISGSGGPKSKADLMTLLICDQLQCLKLTLRSCLTLPTVPLRSSAVLRGGGLYSCGGEHNTTHSHPSTFTPPKCTGQAQSSSCHQVRAKDMCRS